MVTRSPSQLTVKKRAAENKPSATATPNSIMKLPCNAMACAPGSGCCKPLSINWRKATGKIKVDAAAKTKNTIAKPICNLYGFKKGIKPLNDFGFCGAGRSMMGVLAMCYLPMQKLEKITPSKSSALNSPVISFKAVCDKRNSSANKSSDWACARKCASAISMCD